MTTMTVAAAAVTLVISAAWNITRAAVQRCNSVEQRSNSLRQVHDHAVKHQGRRRHLRRCRRQEVRPGNPFVHRTSCFGGPGVGSNQQQVCTLLDQKDEPLRRLVRFGAVVEEAQNVLRRLSTGQNNGTNARYLRRRK
jgi:hypothetical protein